MSGLLEARGLTFPSLPSFPDDHDVLSFLTFSLSEPGPEVMPALGLPCREGLGRGTSPGTCPSQMFLLMSWHHHTCLPAVISTCSLGSPQTRPCAGGRSDPELSPVLKELPGWLEAGEHREGVLTSQRSREGCLEEMRLKEQRQLAEWRSSVDKDLRPERAIGVWAAVGEKGVEIGSGARHRGPEITGPGG